MDCKCLLKRGSCGERVKFVQIALGVEAKGSLGNFGPKTEAAIKEFQRMNGLLIDGIIGPETWAAVCNLSIEGNT